MALADLTDPRAVDAAVAEFRKLGRPAFLKKYGFGRARSYWLLDGDDFFNSKAIVGAAHGHQHPDRGSLTPDQFSGGEETVATKLRSLGFRVSSPSEDAQPRSSSRERTRARRSTTAGEGSSRAGS